MRSSLRNGASRGSRAVAFGALLALGCGGSAVGPGPGTGAAGAAGVGAAPGTGGAAASSAGGVSGSGGAVPEAWVACQSSPDCVLVENRCCQACGPTDLHQAMAVHRDYWDEYQSELCKDRRDPCPQVKCSQPFGQITAVCRSGRCTAIDVRLDEVSACTSNDECVLRWGAQCCEWCSGSLDRSVVALSLSSDFETLFCGDEPVPCPGCEPPPFDWRIGALCVDSGHCQMVTVD